MVVDDDSFSEIDCFDAFMDLVNSHVVRKTPSQIENYINDCKSFFRGVYNLGMIDGFNIASKADNDLKKI